MLAHSDGELIDLLRGGQGVLNVVPLGGVVEELDAAITEFGRTAAAAAEQLEAAAGSGR